MRQQTSVINAIRAHLAEFGIVAPVGRRGIQVINKNAIDILADFGQACREEVASHGDSLSR